mgnify:CR=1 FL=1
MKLSHGYVCGRAAAKIAGLELEKWRKMDHCAHLQCMTMAAEVVESHNTMVEVCDLVMIAFKGGGLKQLREAVHILLVNDDVDRDLARAFADGVTDETTSVREFIENMH